MAANNKRVFYVKYLASPVFAEILGRRPDVQLTRLENETPDAEAEPVLAQAHGYQIGASRDEIVPKYFGTAELLKRTPNLVVMSTNGSGYDTLDLADCTAAGVLAVNQAGGNKEAVAEHVMAMMLTLSKRIVETNHFMRRQSDIPRNDYKGYDLVGRTVGIVGLGHVGSDLVTLLRGLTQRIVFTDIADKSTEAATLGIEAVTYDELLRRCDLISFHVPATELTRHMFSAEAIAKVTARALIINTSRGQVVDVEATCQAVARGQLGGFAADVFPEEPADMRRWGGCARLYFTPHIGGKTEEAVLAMGRSAIAHVRGFLQG